MHLQYTTDRLQLTVLNMEYADRILEFLMEGRETFAMVESPKPEGFYPLNYQSALAHAEYDSFMKGKYFRYYVTLKEAPEHIIGTVSFGNILKAPYNSCIIGYKFLPEYHHKGYATESLRRLIQAVFAENRIHRIEALCLPDNTASIKLLSGLNFQYEGVAHSVLELPDGYRDHNRYSLINPCV